MPQDLDLGHRLRETKLADYYTVIIHERRGEMLTDRIQSQAIVDHLAGLEVKLNPAELTGIYAECWRAVQDKPNKTEKLEALGQVLNTQEVPENARIYQQILSKKPGGLQIESLDAVKDRIAPIEWLWEGWIPRGMITILAAIPGAGKTGLMLDFSRRISSGTESWPDGKPIQNPGANVLYVDAENQPEVIKERAISWKMKTSRFFMKWPQDGEIFDLADQRYQELVYEWAYVVRPELINIDSLSVINTKGENNIEDVRRILSYLTSLARDTKAGLILSHHLRKRPSSILPLLDLTQDDLRGSSHIVAAGRSILGLSVVQTTQEFDPNGPRKLSVLKMNIGPHPKPIGYEIVSGFPTGYALKWGDAPKPYKQPDKVDLCTEWLLEILAEKDRSIKELVKLGEDEDFSKGTIIRARQKHPDLFRDTKAKRDPGNTWTLATPGDGEN